MKAELLVKRNKDLVVRDIVENIRIADASDGVKIVNIQFTSDHKYLDHYISTSEDSVFLSSEPFLFDGGQLLNDGSFDELENHPDYFYLRTTIPADDVEVQLFPAPYELFVVLTPCDLIYDNDFKNVEF